MTRVDCFLGAPHIAQQAASKPFSAGATLVGKPVWTDRQLESHEQDTQVQETLTVPAPPTPEAPTVGSLRPAEPSQSLVAPPSTDLPKPAAPPDSATLPKQVAAPPDSATSPKEVAAPPDSATSPKEGPSTLTTTPGSAPHPPKPLPPVMPATTPSATPPRAEAEAVSLTPPQVCPAPGSSVTPTEAEDLDSVSQAGEYQANKRDPSYWRLRRYFTPRANGTLKCSPEAMKLWQTADGSFQVWIWILCTFLYLGSETIQ